MPVLRTHRSARPGARVAELVSEPVPDVVVEPADEGWDGRLELAVHLEHVAHQGPHAVAARRVARVEQVPVAMAPRAAGTATSRTRAAGHVARVLLALTVRRARPAR